MYLTHIFCLSLHNFLLAVSLFNGISTFMEWQSSSCRKTFILSVFPLVMLCICVSFCHSFPPCNHLPSHLCVSFCHPFSLQSPSSGFCSPIIPHRVSFYYPLPPCLVLQSPLLCLILPSFLSVSHYSMLSFHFVLPSSPSMSHYDLHSLFFFHPLPQ